MKLIIFFTPTFQQNYLYGDLISQFLQFLIPGANQKRVFILKLILNLEAVFCTWNLGVKIQDAKQYYGHRDQAR